MWWMTAAFAGPGFDLPVPSPCAQWWDQDGDGKWDAVQRYEYDADRFLYRITIDDDLDGQLEVAMTLTHDAAGKPLLARHDDDADGKVDRVSDCRKSYCTTNWVPQCAPNQDCTRDAQGLIEGMWLPNGAHVVNDYSCWVREGAGWRAVSGPLRPPPR